MKVTGIGGVFFRSENPAALSEWYEKNLGINNMTASYEPWVQQQGPTVLMPFAKDSDYFGSDSQNFMLNFRVNDLQGMLAQLKANDVKVVKEIEDQAGVGKFASIEDPEGNRVELWQPSDE